MFSNQTPFNGQGQFNNQNQFNAQGQFNNQGQFSTPVRNSSAVMSNPQVNHNHSNQAVSVSLELQEIEKSLNEAQMLKVQSETNLKHYRQQFQECNMELQQLGVNPDSVKAEIERLAVEIKQGVTELKALMSSTLIDDLKAELNKPIEVEIELPDEDIIF